MFHDKIKSLFTSTVNSVVSVISDYAVNPEKDFTRCKKFPADKLITFLVSEGSSSTKNELLDFFDMDMEKPTDSAFNQQRAKLKPEAVEAVFHQFNESVESLAKTPHYRFLAADGSTVTYFSSPQFSPPEYFVEPGHSAKGVYSIHINAFYDLDRHTYTDALLQPVHEKDEFRAFCDIVDRHPVPAGSKNIYIGDRGYCSYNNMAHVIEQGQYFLFRTKDIHSKGLVGNFDFPEEDSFDITVKVTLVRKHSKKSQCPMDINVLWTKLHPLIISNTALVTPMNCPSVLSGFLCRKPLTSALSRIFRQMNFQRNVSRNVILQDGG